MGKYLLFAAMATFALMAGCDSEAEAGNRRLFAGNGSHGGYRQAVVPEAYSAPPVAPPMAVVPAPQPMMVQPAPVTIATPPQTVTVEIPGQSYTLQPAPLMLTAPCPPMALAPMPVMPDCAEPLKAKRPRLLARFRERRMAKESNLGLELPDESLPQDQQPTPLE